MSFVVRDTSQSMDDEFKKLLCKQIVRVVPRFERTTLVEVRDVPDSDSKCNEKMLVCSRCFKKRGYACRHIYKLVNRLPALTDALIGGMIVMLIRKRAMCSPTKEVSSIKK